MEFFRNGNRLFWSSLFLVFFLDQAVKKWIRSSSSGSYFCNFDLAWGISLNKTLFYLLWIFFILALFWHFSLFLKKKKQSFSILFFGGALLGGGFSNMFDRIYLGCVIDFIDLGFFPVFNLADVFIILGSAVLVWKIIEKE